MKSKFSEINGQDLVINRMYNLSLVNEKAGTIHGIDKLIDLSDLDRTNPMLYTENPGYDLLNPSTARISIISKNDCDSMLTPRHLLQFGKQIAAGMVSYTFVTYSNICFSFVLPYH